MADEVLFLLPLQWSLALRACWMCLARFAAIRDLIGRVLVEGTEPFSKRVRTLFHTWLGAYYAVLLGGKSVDHIHVHHGYFSAWIAMVAARFLEIPFSITLHGSDLLLNASYMETKLVECRFCMTVSEFNRQHILAHYPMVDPAKVVLRRMGVAPREVFPAPVKTQEGPAVLLAVGRLHPVKNHIFLLQACYMLRELGLRFRCVIVGEGPERRKLEFLIDELKIQNVVSLVGHVPHAEVDQYYRLADLVVLTSVSEGIPLVLMEAMAQGKIVLAPAITGIPELVVDGQTGFLYKPGSLEDFLWQVLQISDSHAALDGVGLRAREHVRKHFNETQNLERFVNFLLEQVDQHDRSDVDEDLVLQQV
jgi:glycosyltransferase involved in cell wall biosynthesis